MPVIVDGENGVRRRKRFAPKARTGCVKCKARHVKCGEERPTCHRCKVSHLTCSYKVPKQWLFDPNTDLCANSVRRPLQTLWARSTNKDDNHSGSIDLKQRHKSPSILDESLAGYAWTGPRLFKAQHQHDAFSTFITFLVRQIEPRSRFPGDMTVCQDVWSVVIPQIAYHSVALREVMIACGTLVLSVQRKVLQAQHDRDMALVLAHATRAIHELTTKVRPLIEVVLTAYFFWHLNVMCCRFQSALMHGRSAMKIAKQCRKALASDEFASMFVECLILDLPGADSAPLPEVVKDPPEVRRRQAVGKLELEHDRITACARRVAVSDAPSKHDILAILEESRQEIQWILSRYNTSELYTQWLRHKKHQATDPNWTEWLLEDRPGFFQQFVNMVDEHLAVVEATFALTETEWPRVPVDVWRKDAAQETLMFIVMVAGMDLGLRHITMDFFDASRRIRWPRRSSL